MATTRYRSSMQTRHENTGTGRPTVTIHAVTQWLSHSNALQWDSLHKLRNIGFSNTYTSLSRFIWNIAMWPMAKAIPAKKYHNSPTGANVPWRKAKAPVPPVAPLLIHAWTELTEFLYIYRIPFWRPLLSAVADGTYPLLPYPPLLRPIDLRTEFRPLRPHWYSIAR